LPIIITEYTSFGFGDLDDGQEANAQIGYTLDIAAMLLEHYRGGVDAALYWDAVDYLQPGHDAITKWGFLRGPERDFQRRPRFYGMRQILPLLQPGASVLSDRKLGGGADLHTLAVASHDGTPAIVLVSQDWGPIDLTLELIGSQATQFRAWAVTRTERGRLGELLGRVRFQDGVGRMIVPARSVTTLIPSGASFSAEEADDE
jgi:hypothetical protein